MSVIVRYPSAGCVVEYMEGNVPHIAMITEEQGGKVRLLLPNRRETRLTTHRLLPWSGPALPPMEGREAAVQLLEQHRTRRAALLAQIHIMDVWEMAQGEMEHAGAEWFAELEHNAPDIDTVAAYGHALLACKSHFKFQPPYFEVYAATTVQARLQEQEVARQREALVMGGSQFFHILWDVYQKKRALPLENTQDTTSVWPDPIVTERLKKLILQRVANPETQEDDMLWRTLVKGLPDAAHLPLHLANAWGLLPTHYNFWMDRADYCADRSWEQAHTASITVMETAVRALGEPTLPLPFISIDSATTRDVDDAFFVEALPDGGIRLYLALACPALLWAFGSELDAAVARRATSIYLPEATYHMLPEILGTDVFSLRAGATRPALCFVCDVNAQGEIQNCILSLEQVRLAAHLHFEDCEAVLEAAHTGQQAQNTASPYAAQLVLAETLATARQAARITAGAVVMDRPDPKIILNGEGADITVRIEEAIATPRAQMLVAEAMILASTACVPWAQERNIPLLYRTQDVTLPREYTGVWTAPHDMSRVIRALVPSILEITPRPHAGLGVTAYSPVTSPLRRYADLINEAQFVTWLQKGVPLFDAAALEALLLPLHVRLDAVGQVQRFRSRYWKLLYVQQMGDKHWWPGVVTEENDHSCSVSLPVEQLFVRGRRHLFSEPVYAGQPVRVRLGKVNPLYNEIYILETTCEVDNKG